MAGVTEAEIVELLRREIQSAGSQRQFARANGISTALVCNTLNGKWAPGVGIARALGFVVTLERQP